MDTKDKVRQNEILDELYEKRDKLRKETLWFLGGAIFFTAFFLLEVLKGICFIWGIMLWICVIASVNQIREIDDDIACAERDIKEYDRKKEEEGAKQRALVEAELTRIQQEKEYAERTQREGAPWEVKYFTEPCPCCGHYKVRFSDWEDKRYSVAFWGAASDKIGKAYKCEHCGKMW